MSTLSRDAVGEYQALLEQLADEDELLKEQAGRNKKRRDEINAQVKGIIAQLGTAKERIVVPVSDGRGWDRRANRKGGGLSLGQLEAVLGRRVYRALCDKVTEYVFSPDKLELARKTGTVTDEMMAAATVEPDITHSLQIIKCTEESISFSEELEGL